MKRTIILFPYYLVRFSINSCNFMRYYRYFCYYCAMKEKCLNNAIRLAVATNCLKSKSLPPIKYPREVIMYKYDSFLNQCFEFDMNEPIVYSRMKLDPKSDVLVIGTGIDIYDFAISYLSSHDKGLLSLIAKDNNYIEESVYQALNKQGYFKHYLLENNSDTFLEKTYKSLEKYLSSGIVNVYTISQRNLLPSSFKKSMIMNMSIKNIVKGW